MPSRKNNRASSVLRSKWERSAVTLAAAVDDIEQKEAVLVAVLAIAALEMVMVVNAVRLMPKRVDEGALVAVVSRRVTRVRTLPPEQDSF